MSKENSPQLAAEKEILYICFQKLKRKASHMIQQTEITLRARGRGFHLITTEVAEKLPRHYPSKDCCICTSSTPVAHWPSTRMPTLTYDTIWNRSSTIWFAKASHTTPIHSKEPTICRHTPSRLLPDAASASPSHVDDSTWAHGKEYICANFAITAAHAI